MIFDLIFAVVFGTFYFLVISGASPYCKEHTCDEERGEVLVTLIPREICSLSSWIRRARGRNLAGKSPPTDWCNYIGRVILLLKWREVVLLAQAVILLFGVSPF